MISFLKTVGSFLFGGDDKASSSMNFVQKSVEGIGNYIDEQKFTEQEASEFQLKKSAMVLEAIKSTRDENSTRSVTRRVLAWAVMGTYLALVGLAILAYPISVEYSDFIFKSVEKSYLGELSIAVGAFYFGASIARARK